MRCRNNVVCLFHQREYLFLNGIELLDLGVTQHGDCGGPPLVSRYPRLLDLADVYILKDKRNKYSPILASLSLVARSATRDEVAYLMPRSVGLAVSDQPDKVIPCCGWRITVNAA